MVGNPTLVTARMRCSLTLSDACCTLSAYAADVSASCDLHEHAKQNKNRLDVQNCRVGSW